MSFAVDRSTTSAPLSQINITPLVDVMLTVLIIFMVTTPIVLKKVPLPLQGSEAKPEVEPRVLGVAILDDGRLVLGERPTTRGELDTELRIAAANGPVRLEIRPQSGSAYDDLAQVLVLASNANVSNVGVEVPSGH